MAVTVVLVVLVARARPVLMGSVRAVLAGRVPVAARVAPVVLVVMAAL